MWIKKYLLTVIAITVVSLIVIGTVPVTAQAPVLPIKLKPSLKVKVYPDGSASINYYLNMTVSIPKAKNTTGSAILALKYKEDVKLMKLIMTLGGSFITGKPKGTPIKSASMLSVGGLELKSYEEGKAILELSATLEFKNTSKGVTNVTKVYLKSFKAYATPKNATITFVAEILGLTKVPYLKGEVSKIINMQLSTAGIDFMKFKELWIKRQDTKSLLINGTLTLDIDRLISYGVKMKLITPTNVSKIKSCIKEGFKNLEGGSKLDFWFINRKFVGNASTTDFKGALGIIVRGDIKGYREVQAKCSGAYAKLALVVSMLMMRLQTKYAGAKVPPTPMPIAMPSPIKAPNITLVYPYRAEALVKIRLTNGTLTLELNVSTGRFKYPVAKTPEERAGKTLGELRDYLGEVSKRLGFLKLMGIESPIPEKVSVIPVSMEGKPVGTSITTSLYDLPLAGVKAIKGYVSPTPTVTPKTVTIRTTSIVTFTKTVTKTVTTTKMLTSTITSTITSTKVLTTTLTKTTTITTTKLVTHTKVVEKPMTSVTIGLIMALVIVIIASALLALRRR